jgi:hypothetical protein
MFVAIGVLLIVVAAIAVAAIYNFTALVLLASVVAIFILLR